MPAAKSPSTKKDYQTLNAELESVLVELQQPDVQVDDAVKLYEKGMKLVQELETFVAQAENKLIKVQLQMGAANSEE